jgi:uncharacterized membrane protein
MATLSVLKFGTAEGAEEALKSLTEMQKQQLITVQDAAIVSWPAGQKKPKTRQAFSTVSAGALGGAFWGMLFGLIFFVPFLGLAIGAAMGALGGKMQDYGISDQLIKDIKSKVTEGTSALFVLSANAVGDRVVAEMKQWPHFEILSTNLSAEQEAQLRAEFGEG